MRSLSWLLLVVGCGARTSLSLEDSSGAGASAGAHSSTGGTNSGGTSSADAGSSAAVAGGKAGTAPGGASSGGNADAGAASGGVAAGGAPSCIDPRLLSVSPALARVGVPKSTILTAELSCPLNPTLPSVGSMRATGRYAGLIPGSIQVAATGLEVSFVPQAPEPTLGAFLPGELVTGWVSARLGGPFQWQFVAATRRKGSPSFTDTGQALAIAEEAELGDLDHDGDLDLVTASSFENVGRVWLNDGMGNFSLHVTLPPSAEALLADMDGDGDVDIVSTHLSLNDGHATFTQSVEMGAVQAVFDADGDGDLDVFTQQVNDEPTLLFNDGKANFPLRSVLLSADLLDAKAGDLDNDGDLDLVAIIYDTAKPRVARMVLLLNDGAGAFVETPSALVYDATRTLALGDVNGDGFSDVFLASWGAAGARNPDDQVWLNDGKAHFTLGDSPISGSIHVVLQDLDGDNDLDAIVGQHEPYSVVAGSPSRILINDGTGHFTPGGSLGGPNFQHLAMGDLDGDGDLDAVVAQWDWTLHPSVQVWRQDD